MWNPADEIAKKESRFWQNEPHNVTLQDVRTRTEVLLQQGADIRGSPAAAELERLISAYSKARSLQQLAVISSANTANTQFPQQPLPGRSQLIIAVICVRGIASGINTCCHQLLSA